MTIGERAYTTYIRHPAAGTSLFGDGFGIDSGTVMLMLDNNTAVLERESVRTLAEGIGSGDPVEKFTTDAGPTSGLSDVGSTTFTGTNGYDEIYWDRRTAICLGPFYGVADRLTSEYRSALRRVRIRAQFYLGAGNTTQTAHFGITSWSDPLAMWMDGRLAYQSVPMVGTGTQTVTVDLPGAPGPGPELAMPGYTIERVRCRTAATYGATITVVYPFYVWIGWGIVNPFGINSSYLDAYAAWEIR